jgi:hypothetical protein
MSEIDDGSMPQPRREGSPDLPTRHGYWGPLPGESVGLYTRLGVPALMGAMER